MKWFILFVLLLVAILLESTITSLPLVFIVLLCAAVFFRNSVLFLWSFFAGLILDSVLLQPLGKSSLFFVVFFTIVVLYERKFEIQSTPFVGIFSFVGSFLYLWIFGYGANLWESVTAAFLGIVLFLLWFVVWKRLD